jgi:phage terminase Nu1 subunit (DNA packaging protein)
MALDTVRKTTMAIEAAFLTYATKRIADISQAVEIMEAKTRKVSEVQPGGQEVDMTDQTLAAYKAEREALQGIKNELEAGNPI